MKGLSSLNVRRHGEREGGRGGGIDHRQFCG